MENKDLVYLLTVKEAIELAKEHEDEDAWTLWTDPKALALGLANQPSSALCSLGSQTAI